MYFKHILLVFFSTFLLSKTFSQDAVNVAKKTFPYTVSIVMQDQFKKTLSLGSGFIVSPGKIVTNVHVVEGSSYGDVIEDKSGKTHKIEGYTALDTKNDLVILSVPTLTLKGLQLGDTITQIGQRIFAIGNPKGLNGTISEGIVSGIRQLDNNDLFQITAPISPGSSGGPVLDIKGNVIGVSVASLTSGQNLNFAIPSRYVKFLIKSDKNILLKLNTIKPNPEIKRTEKDKPTSETKEGVFISDLVWGFGHGDFNQYLSRISITNMTDNTIHSVEMIVIFYKNNLPVDYCEFTLFPNTKEDYFGSGPIKPFLGKTITTTQRGSSNRCSGYRFYLMKDDDEKAVFRILNYSIME
jgi:S1-C subfamily serine protease